jgi:type IV secretory pathway VirB2 component (pilin)
MRPTITLTLLLIAPALASAQSPFDTGFTALQTLFTGTVTKVASLIAIVVGGYQFAHGESGGKRSRFGYVAISRASQEATVFTNDTPKLGQRLGTEISKSSAVELTQTPSIGQDLAMSIH